jgi:peptidoglycan-associated lipoprotein
MEGEKMIFNFKKCVFLTTMLILSLTLFVGCPKDKGDVELPPDDTGTAVRGDEVVEQPTTRTWDSKGPVETRPSTGEIPKVSDSGAFETVYFDFDKSNLRDDSVQIIQRNLQILKNNSDMKILIEGHCDERGTNEYNMALGMRRANTCKNYFIANGIDSSRMSVISYGEERPIDSGSGENAWMKNRRAEFLVVSK